MKNILTALLTSLFLALTMIVLASCADEPCQHRDADDNSICDTCEESYTDGTDVHVHYFTQRNTHSSYLVSAADCENAATYYYSCSCGIAGTETFTDGEALGHTEVQVEENLIEATCIKEGSCDEVILCDVCDKELSRTHKIIAATGVHKTQNGACTMCLAREGSPGLAYSRNSDGTYTVRGIGTCNDTDIVIGSIYNNRNVKDIGYEAFINEARLTSVIILDGVKHIGTGAFYDCYNITSITLPSSITTIGTSAFQFCSGIKSVTIPANVTLIENSAFYYCTSLTSVYFINPFGWYSYSEPVTYLEDPESAAMLLVYSGQATELTRN